MNFTKTMSVVLVIVVVGIAIAFSINEKDKPVVAMSRGNYAAQTHTIDSLKNVVDSLQTQIFLTEDGCDYREHRYEDVIDEYELGMSYLQDYHPKAYKDFHRIIGMKERYSTELDRENQKILKSYEYNR
jgi:5-formaminoimidazole-4-carboxamide-1-beta-D-ribofuranosyl 5'-monophosphate synthetase